MQKVILPIESSKEDSIHPLRPDFGWFSKMFMIVTFCCLFALGGSYIFSWTILTRIDLAIEREYFGDMNITENMNVFDMGSIRSVDLGPVFTGYTIYIQDSPVENAFAMIGGNIIITSGLLENIQNEEEIIFILGHERAHIENRDVIRGFAQSMPIILTLQSLGIDTGDSMTKVGTIITSYSSREKESSADDAGIMLLENLGLNPLCATGFFKRHQSGFETYIKILSDHPTSKDRLKKLTEKQGTIDTCTPYVMSE